MTPNTLTRRDQPRTQLNPKTSSDSELLRLHRRACTDFAARLRLPAWEHLRLPLPAPLGGYTVEDLLCRVANANLAAAAELSGQPAPPPVGLGKPDTGEINLIPVNTGGSGPTQVVLESVRTVLAVVAGLDAGAGISPAQRQLLWDRGVELTVLGYDLQQAIHAGTGLDELLVDRVLAAAPTINPWPGLPPVEADFGTPANQMLLARAGRTQPAWNHPGHVAGHDTGEASCATGNC